MFIVSLHPDYSTKPITIRAMFDYCIMFGLEGTVHESKDWNRGACGVLGSGFLCD